jgi:hypothetical protein
MYEIDIKVIRLNNTNMPKTPTDFSKALIYSIVCKTDETLLYIGSTTNFKIRKNMHKKSCINEKHRCHNYPVYVMIRATGGWDNFEMKPVKEYACENKIQLVIEEERIRKEMKANLNTRRAFRTPEERQDFYKEYSAIHKEHVADYRKQYNKDNAEKIAERAKKYNETNAEQVADYRKQYEKDNAEKIAERKKQYRKDNPEKFAERAKKYYEKNKELIAEQEKQYREANAAKIAERRKIKRQELKNAL